MTSVVVQARAISVDEAIRQFDVLYDEFFEITQPEPVARVMSSRAKKMSSNRGEDRLESAGSVAQEMDEVCTDSAIDSERQENIRQLARELAKLGDEYSKKFGGNYTNVDSILSSLFTKTSVLEYETFKTTLESLVAQGDHNAINFTLLMCLSSKVVANVGHYATKAKSFFRRYISNNYVATVAEAGGVETFVGKQT